MGREYYYQETVINDRVLKGIGLELETLYKDLEKLGVDEGYLRERIVYDEGIPDDISDKIISLLSSPIEDVAKFTEEDSCTRELAKAILAGEEEYLSLMGKVKTASQLDDLIEKKITEYLGRISEATGIKGVELKEVDDGTVKTLRVCTDFSEVYTMTPAAKEIKEKFGDFSIETISWSEYG
jgi:hypothetical protein